MVEQSFKILLYHGVTTAKQKGIENFSQKHISLKDFKRQMNYLASNYDVRSLRDLLKLKHEKRIPKDAIAVTFDDGFKNNYLNAYPILSKYNIPATFYLSTRFIGSDEVFWVDKIEYLINKTTRDKLYIQMLGAEYQLESAQGEMESTKNKISAILDIKSKLKCTPALINATIIELEEKCETDKRYIHEDYKTMDWDDVRDMDRTGIFEFGSHTVDHEIMSHLHREQKKYQIYSSKHILEKELGKKIDLFSYPEGQDEHFDRETIEILKSAGFISSPSAIFGTNYVDTDNFRLKRNMVGYTAPFDACIEGDE